MLKWYAAVMTVAVIILTVAFFTSKRDGAALPEHLALKELDVERINIAEADGTLKMVISNKERQHPGLVDGKELPARSREAGIIFFNSAGDECGGLVYDGTKDEAGFAISVDQFRNDQLMQLHYVQEGSGDSVKRHYGLKLWDRSDKFTLARQIAFGDSLQKLNNEAVLKEQFKLLREKGLLGVERMFAGRTDDGEVGLFIRDTAGRIRIKIACDAANNARIVVLDEAGKEMQHIR